MSFGGIRFSDSSSACPPIVAALLDSLVADFQASGLLYSPLSSYSPAYVACRVALSNSRIARMRYRVFGGQWRRLKLPIISSTAQNLFTGHNIWAPEPIER